MERVPVLRMGDYLLVTMQADVHDHTAIALQEDLTHKIQQCGARGVLVDISSVTVVDSFVGRMIATISAMASILDAKTVVVGMQPAVAITLVELGLTLGGIETALDVEKGMQKLRAATEKDHARGEG